MILRRALRSSQQSQFAPPLHSTPASQDSRHSCIAERIVGKNDHRVRSSRAFLRSGAYIRTVQMGIITATLKREEFGLLPS